MTKNTSMPTKTIAVTPAITANAYHANDCVGGKMTLTDALISDGGSAMLWGMLITDLANQKPAGQMVIFNADPTAATLTNHAAIAFSTDLSKVVAMIDVTADDWKTIGGIGMANPLWARTLEAPAGTKLYAAFMASGTPTFASVADLTFSFLFTDRK